MTVIRGWSLLELLRHQTATDTGGEARHFRVMRNQRDYAWQVDKQVAELLEDLQIHLSDASNASPDERYVLGSMILCPSSKAGRALGEGLDTLTNYDVIDGQQRLITLIAIVSALRSIAGVEKLNHMAERLTPVLNDVSVDHHEPSMRQALSRAIQGTCEPDFSDLAANLTDESEKHSGRSAANFIAVAQGLFDQLRTLQKEDSSLVSALSDLVVHKTLFAVTLSGNSSNALLAFERANNRGKALDVNDLLKNYVFMKSDKDEALDDATTQKIDDLWKVSRDTMEAKDVNLPFTDLIRWHHRATATAAINLKGAKLYSTVEDEIDNFSGTAVEYVTALKQSAEWVAKVHRDGEREPGDPIDGLYGLRMIRGSAKMKQHLPVLLAARGTDDDTFAVLARRLEALTLVSIVCKVRNQEIERIYDESFRILKSPKNNAEGRIRTAIDLLLGKTNEMSAERRFAAALARLRYSRPAEVKVIRYVLARVDGALESSTRKEELSTWTNFRSIAPLKGTSKSAHQDHLDHVHPKSSAKDWSGDSTDVDTIGNLVLWPERPNKRAGATPAETKLREDYRASPGNNVRYLIAEGPANYSDHGWAMGLGLRQATEWSTPEVRMLSGFYARAIGQILDFEVTEV